MPLALNIALHVHPFRLDDSLRCQNSSVLLRSCQWILIIVHMTSDLMAKIYGCDKFTMFSKKNTYYCKFLFLVLFHHFRTRPKSVLSFYTLYIYPSLTSISAWYPHISWFDLSSFRHIQKQLLLSYKCNIGPIRFPWNLHSILHTHWEILVKSPMLEIISRQCRKPSGDSDAVCRESGQGERLKTQWFQILSLNNV